MIFLPLDKILDDTPTYSKLLSSNKLDFAKAIFSGNEDGMKKAQAKFIKRVIIAVVIFLIAIFLF